ncbi:MAG: LytTR family DNA-binding domain-containing protein [Gammaproteobacteria bacterium]|nr:LytTR family DNA-binding domain-containing protein [Gammaproteobacteria bacterium]MDH5630334.1 LytTR family DNA-binding domain-containing protein [Gammaproteobacteria bacterium]
MKILVVDDEPLARQRLEGLLAGVDQISAIVTAENGLRAVEICQDQEIDVVLMDIRMPGMDGLEAAGHIAKNKQPPAIIFTTAYDEYALEAFKVNAVNYLLKPVRKTDLISAIQASSKLNKAQLAAIATQQQEAKPSDDDHKGRKHITTKISGNIKLIPVVDVVYFLAEQKYVTVRHLNGETIIEDTLKELQVEFEGQFIRIHRNALVAKKFITGMRRDNQGHAYINFEVINKELEISRRHLSTVKQLLLNM